MNSKYTYAALKSGAAAAAVSIALASTTAFAQQAPASQDSSDGEGQTIVVTGSLLRNASTDTPSPITVISSETLDRAGITNISDAIRQASADGAGSIGLGFTSGFSAGGAAVSLRNLGVSSTLVLVDGLRSAQFPLSDDGHNSYVDLNSIPQVNLERVEVLKDGASSTYGADAIGGVVNIITRKKFNGIEGGAEAGVSQKGDGQKYRMRLLAGFGDYDNQGFNVYVGGEYERNGKITANSRGFPFNTLDLTAMGGRDNNRADDTLTTATPNAVVTRVVQTDLNNPLAGSVTNATGGGGTPAIFDSLTPLGNCPYGVYTVNTAAQFGSACKHDLTKEYVQILPKQERYAGVGRLSFRFGDTIEGYVAGSYSHNKVDITLLPRAVRQNQAFGGSPSTSTTNPGVVLPVYICSSGVNCATAADRKLNPNNPYAAAFANDPANGAARLYYLFGDVKSGSVRTNELYRITAGLKGTLADTWHWALDVGYSRDDLKLTQTGWANLPGLVKAINTGTYNFVDPSKNSQAVRDSVLTPITSLSNSSEFTIDGSVTRSLFALPGGDMQIAVGGQFRKEKLANRSANPNRDVPGLSTAQAFGKRDVWAAFFEVSAPILDSLEVTGSGRYDHYSEGFSAFSPKVGFKFSPIEQVTLRGTYSKGFRAPTFAEIDPRSSFSGFVGLNPGAAFPDFKVAHAANPGYYANYSAGRGFVGNPDIKPEKSRSFTLGVVFEPTSWFSFTADYFNVKKSGLITAGPLAGEAINAYYSVAGQNFASAAAAAAAGCAKVEAVGAGYSCDVIDGADPFALNALPRLLVVNAPYVNTDYDLVTGVQFGANVSVPVSENIHFNSRLDLQGTLKFNRHLDGGDVQKFAGSVGPADLSSGGGTPKWRGNWQNTVTFGQFSLTATTYFVGSMKAIATDQGHLETTCNETTAVYDAKFCKIKRFIYADLNANFEVNEDFSFYAIIGNVTNARAPVYPNTFYTTQPNYLASWHIPGLVGRTFRMGANFKF